ncbi:molybdenum cofactor biosynthesis protein MoaE [Asticcacaulis sp. BYS171W]|uniref:Molybdopterin synthase catalytic subunit n=1 Tax=Asticcacaulis aquaticus TaxID=2984212 RepID=A0ABT5HWS5_9CAUL|nr:molybdenum cofactor biosynthesis protein MoaE [Asticcacaulis aquaticus]MDC7684429.1 molybdenum cofactor biosynthesis protein MoaE [Asticcacaulis aquaticus]
MTSSIHAEIKVSRLNIEDAMDFADRAENGACALFVGRVRNHNLGRPVDGVSYDAFDDLARNTLREICTEAVSRFGEDLTCFVEHFKGFLPIGGISVIIAVGSPHRDSAYRANRYIIEELKKRVPVWKEEHYTDGQPEWLEGQSVEPDR